MWLGGWIMAGGGVDAVISAMVQLPANASQVSDPVLATRMRQLVRLRAMVDAALVEQLAVFDARAGARYDGQTSTQAWLRSRLRLGGQAGNLVRVARHLSGLPLVAKAFAAGEISLEHAAAIAQLASGVGAELVADYETVLLDLARQAPPTKLRIACEHLRQLLDPARDADEAARQRRVRYLSAARTIDGMVHLQGLLDAVSGDAVLTALQAAMPPPAEYEERTAAQRRADALTDVCAGWLASGEAATNGGTRPQVQVTVSLRTLQASLASDRLASDRLASDRLASDSPRRSAQEDDDATDLRQLAATVRRPVSGISEQPRQSVMAGRQQASGPPISAPQAGLALLGDVPVLADGQPIPIAEARRLACDAGIIPVVLGSRSEPLDVGRHARLVPVGLRRALNLRDGGCRFAGCDRPAAWCDAHHVTHWADGGETSIDNMILLCAYHHTLIHEGWRILGDPNGMIQFRRPDGTRLELTSAPRCRPPTRGL